MKVDRYSEIDTNKDAVMESYHDSDVLDRAGPVDEEHCNDDVAFTDITDSSPIMDKSDDDDYNSEEKATKKRRLLVIGGVLLALTGVAVGSYFLADHVKEKKCQAQMKDIREPILELRLSANQTNRELNETEIKELQFAIIDGYNVASGGGCDDELERHMIGAVLTNQTVVQTFAVGEGDETVSIEFGSMTSLTIQVQTIISCDGCMEEDAFAATYPSTFGSSDSRRLTGGVDAGAILQEIEKRVQSVLPGLGQIDEASVLGKEGGLAKMNRGFGQVRISFFVTALFQPAHNRCMTKNQS
jgi:hypothetical protein